MLKSHEVPQRFFRMRNLPYLKVLAPPFRILQRVKSPPFHIPKASKRYPFRVEPPRIGHHMEYGTPPPPLPSIQNYRNFLSNGKHPLCLGRLSGLSENLGRDDGT